MSLRTIANTTVVVQNDDQRDDWYFVPKDNSSTNRKISNEKDKKEEYTTVLLDNDPILQKLSDLFEDRQNRLIVRMEVFFEKVNQRLDHLESLLEKCSKQWEDTFHEHCADNINTNTKENTKENESLEIDPERVKNILLRRRIPFSFAPTHLQMNRDCEPLLTSPVSRDTQQKSHHVPGLYDYLTKVLSSNLR